MWAIRILSGPQSGHFYPLREGKNTIGRSTSCDIKLIGQNISKEHAQILVKGTQVAIVDLDSRNGTFLNSVKLQKPHILTTSDRVSIHEVIFELVPESVMHQNRTPISEPVPPAYQNHGSHQAHYSSPNSSTPAEHFSGGGSAQFKKMLLEYMDRVVLPGVYRLAEWIDFKTLLGLFLAAFVFLVTALSTIPLVQILRESVEQQSQEHAKTIASTLARVNEAAVRDGLYTAINMSTAQRAGVLDALIISKLDGKIIAPASKAESYPDLPFVNEARNYDQESVRQIDSSTIVALHPIISFNSETGQRSAIAFAVVKYDMTSLAVDGNKTFSLVIMTLFIASLIGGILYYFFYKLIEFPLVSLNYQLDQALREGRDDLKSQFQFEPIQRLVSNINSAMTRAISAGAGASIQSQAVEHDRRLEMINIVEIIGYPCLTVSAFDRTIVSVNQGFEQRTRIEAHRLINQPVQAITDQALKLSLLDLIERLTLNPDQLTQNEIEFSGINHQIIGQAIHGTSQVAFFIFIVVPQGGDS